MNRYRDIELTFRNETKADFKNSHEWNGFSVTRATLNRNAEYEFSWNDNFHYITLHDITLKGGEVSIEYDGISNTAENDLRNTFTYAPAGSKIKGWSQATDRENAFTALYFEPHLLADELEVKFAESNFRPSIYFRNRNLQFIMNRLTEGLIGASALDKLHIETLGLLVALEIGTSFRQEKRILNAESSGLTSYQKKRLDEYIHVHLGGNISLDELARIAGLSRFHLSRMFKISFGMAPYQYVTHLRIQEAANILRESNFPVNQVGMAVGFNSTSQFIKLFVAEKGVTPGQYRRKA